MNEGLDCYFQNMGLVGRNEEFYKGCLSISIFRIPLIPLIPIYLVYLLLFPDQHSSDWSQFPGRNSGFSGYLSSCYFALFMVILLVLDLVLIGWDVLLEVAMLSFNLVQFFTIIISRGFFFFPSFLLVSPGRKRASGQNSDPFLKLNQANQYYFKISIIQ